jgi:hypothetical protein
MDLAEKGWITRYSVGQPRQALEERHAQRAVFLKYDGQRVWQILDRRERPLVLS